MVTQVANELQRTSNSLETISVDERNDSSVQLGLCHIAGFGVEKSKPRAIELLMEAARRGCYKSRAVLPSLFTAFEIYADESLRSEFIDWQIHASSMGSKTASRYLNSLNMANDTFRWVSNDFQQSQNQPELLHAVACGNIEQVTSLLKRGILPMTQGRQGDTPLHRSVLLPVDLGIPIATALISHGANPSDLRRRPWRPVSLSRYEFLFNAMPQGTSAMDWAVIENNLPMLKLMLQNSTNPSVAKGLLHTACQYLSIECLEYLFEHLAIHGQGRSAELSFKSGYSLLYYSIRPDIFNRLLAGINMHTTGDRSRHVTSLQRQLEIIRILQTVDTNINMTPEKSFSVIHLLNAYGEPEVLESILRNEAFHKLIDEPSSESYGSVKPLREAIVRGRVDSLRVLLSQGADFESVCNSTHAIHVCAQLRERAVCDIVEILISQNPACIFTRSRNFDIDDKQSGYNGYELLQAQRKKSRKKLLTNATALHWAAYYNNTDLVRLCLSKGLDLLEPDAAGYTPLGLAVASRSVRTVRLLRTEHAQKGLPLQARDLRYKIWRSSSAVLYVMTTARLWNPIEPRDEDSPTPFSRSSQLMIKILVRDYKPTVRFGSNSIYRILFHSCYEAGVGRAVLGGDPKAIEDILECKSLQAPVSVLRSLIQDSLDGIRQSGPIYRHPSQRDNLQAILEYLIQKYDNEYERVKSQRESSFASSFWKLYYRSYGDFEENQYQQSLTWQKENEMDRELLWKEFEGTPYSEVVPGILISWCFLIPLFYSHSRTYIFNSYLGPSFLLVRSSPHFMNRVLMCNCLASGYGWSLVAYLPSSSQVFKCLPHNLIESTAVLLGLSFSRLLFCWH